MLLNTFYQWLAARVMALMIAAPWVEKCLVALGRRYPSLPGYWRIVQGYPAWLRARSARSWRWAKTGNGIWMYVDAADRLHGTVWYRRAPYERSTSAFVRAQLEPGHVFLDVGANMGYFSLLAAHCVGQAGKVIAFEPNPTLAAAIRQSVTRNGWEGRVTIVEAALTDHVSQDAAFYLSADQTNSGLSSFSESWAKSGSDEPPERISVQCTALDEWIRQVPLDRLDMVKIDVEGEELKCLQGMRQTLKILAPQAVICETPEGSEAQRVLESMGYDGVRSRGTLNGIFRRIRKREMLLGAGG